MKPSESAHTKKTDDQDPTYNKSKSPSLNSVSTQDPTNTKQLIDFYISDKHVLSQALHDVQFFHRYPKVKNENNFLACLHLVLQNCLQFFSDSSLI